MEKSEISLSLDGEATRLEMVTATLIALDTAMVEGKSAIEPTAFSIPCLILKEISENITSLVNKLFEKGNKAA